MLYNPSDHPYHRLALKIKKAASVIFTELYNQLAQSVERQVALGGAFSLEPSRELLEPLLDVEPGSNRDRLADLFARELESLPPPSPLPKYKPIVTSEERQARRQAKIGERRARAEALRLASSRQTRSNAPALDEQTLDEDKLPEEPLSPAVRPKIRRKREPVVETSEVHHSAPRSLRSGRSAGPTVAKGEIQAILPSVRKQTGVIGTMAYSPLTDQERRARERDMELVVDTVDNKDYFERFNIGFILPEGTKRGGRPFIPTAPVAGPSRRRQGEFNHFQYKPMLTGLVLGLVEVVSQLSVEGNLTSVTPRKSKSKSPPIPDSSDISDAPEEADTPPVDCLTTGRRSVRLPAVVPAPHETIAPREVSTPSRVPSSRASSPLSPARSTDSLLTPISSPTRRSLTPKPQLHTAISTGKSRNSAQPTRFLGRSTRSARVSPDPILASTEIVSEDIRAAKRRRTESRADTETISHSGGRRTRQRQKSVEWDGVAKPLPDTMTPELSTTPIRIAPVKPKIPTLPKSRSPQSKETIEISAENHTAENDSEVDPVYDERIQRFHGYNGTEDEENMAHDAFLPGTLGKSAAWMHISLRES